MMAVFSEIEFNAEFFPTRKMNLAGYGEVLIATTSLSNKIVSVSGGYLSNEAKFVDEQIFYFVDDHQIRLNEANLKSLILGEIL